MNYENNYANEDKVEDGAESESELESESEVTSEAGSDNSAKHVTKAQYMREQKTSDPDYHKIVRRANKKTMSIEMYSTRCNPGVLIRDPRFGTKCKDRVGTLAERSYFKVRMTSFGDGCEPVTLFYDSPEGYEKHQRTRLPHDIKQSWRSRFTPS